MDGAIPAHRKAGSSTPTFSPIFQRALCVNAAAEEAVGRLTLGGRTSCIYDGSLGITVILPMPYSWADTSICFHCRQDRRRGSRYVSYLLLSPDLNKSDESAGLV